MSSRGKLRDRNMSVNPGGTDEILNLESWTGRQRARLMRCASSKAPLSQRGLGVQDPSTVHTLEEPTLLYTLGQATAARTWMRCTKGESLVSQRSLRSSLISLLFRTAGLSLIPAPRASSRLNSGEPPYCPLSRSQPYNGRAHPAL